MHRFSTIVADLPSTVPFTAPETLERRSGRPLRLRMGANESPFGISPLAVSAMADAAAHGNHYNDPEGYDLRSEIARRHHTTIEHILLGAGADDLLLLVCRLFLNPGDPVVTSHGGYPTFNYGVAGVGGQAFVAPYLRDRNDLEGLNWLASRSQAKLVYLANPDNPSGSWFTPSEMEAFRAQIGSESVLLLDEAYADFVPEHPAFSPDDPGVIRLRTFSKAHGMAGLRVGYAITHPDIVRAAEKIRLHFGVNRVAQAGALASLSDRGHLQTVIDQTAVARGRLSEIACALGLGPLPSFTNFVTIDCDLRTRAEGILAGLHARDVFIRKPGVAPLDRCIRVTVARPAELELFAEILSHVVRDV